MGKFYPSLVKEFFSGNKKYLLFILLVKCSLNLFAQPTINSFSPTSGKNLSGVTAVSFGGTPANFFFNIDSVTIRAYVGQGSSGEVSVTTSKNTSSLAGFTFNVFAIKVSGYCIFLLPKL